MCAEITCCCKNDDVFDMNDWRPFKMTFIVYSGFDCRVQLYAQTNKYSEVVLIFNKTPANT